jgi:transposase
MTKYRIKLSQEEVITLQTIVSKGSHTTQAYRAAYILLNVDEGEFSMGKITGQQLCDVLKISYRTIDRVKKKLVEQGMDAGLHPAKSSRVYESKIDGDKEAKLVTLCCSEPPKGYARWSLRLLADTMVKLDYIDSISHVTVRKVLKKTNLSLGKLKDG